MAELKFDPELSDACGALLPACNGSFIEAFDNLAKALTSHAGEGVDYFDSMIERCKEVQNLYNDGGFCDSLKTFIDEVQKYFDLGEKFSKMEAEGLKKADLELDSARIASDVL